VFQNPQTEIVNLITDSGLTPTDTDLHQLSESVQNGKVMFGVDAGAPNAIAVTLTPAPPAYSAGMTVRILIANNVTGATTINCNGLGLKTAMLGQTALSSGLLKAGDIGEFTYDGTYFQLIAGARSAPSGPVYLTAALILYVNGSTGSDTLYDGTSATVSGSHGPFATIQKAANTAALFNLNGFNITINVANGTYVPVSFPSITGAGFVFLTGAGIGSCTIGTLGASTTAIKLLAGSFNISGFLLQASGAIVGNDPVCGVAASGGQTSVTLTSMAWGVCSGCHIAATNGALINYGGAHTISGGCTGNAQVPGAHIFAYSGGAVQNISGNAPSITIASAVTFASSFVYAQILGIIQVIYNSLTNPSNVTGGRYIVASNAIINTAGGGASYFPGTIAGTAATGGQYF
jgi:hypothetical protein